MPYDNESAATLEAAGLNTEGSSVNHTHEFAKNSEMVADLLISLLEVDEEEKTEMETFLEKYPFTALLRGRSWQVWWRTANRRATLWQRLF